MGGKGSGRPKGSKNRTKVKPKKSTTSKKKRGRPKGSKNKPKVTSTPKAGRGRPAGRKNKPKGKLVRIVPVAE